MVKKGFHRGRERREKEYDTKKEFYKREETEPVAKKDFS